jgi:hypothetical protein
VEGVDGFQRPGAGLGRAVERSAYPKVLQEISAEAWRHAGHTRERLELLAAAWWRSGGVRRHPGGRCAGVFDVHDWPHAAPVLQRHAPGAGPAPRCLRPPGNDAIAARPGRPLRTPLARAARRRAAGPMCCPPDAISIQRRHPRRAHAHGLRHGCGRRGTTDRAAPARPRRDACARWACPSGAPAPCAPAAKTWRRPSRCWACGRSGPTAARA